MLKNHNQTSSHHAFNTTQACLKIGNICDTPTRLTHYNTVNYIKNKRKDNITEKIVFVLYKKNKTITLCLNAFVYCQFIALFDYVKMEGYLNPAFSPGVFSHFFSGF